MGYLATPTHYQEIRQQLHDDLIASLKIINQEYDKYHKIINIKSKIANLKSKIIENGLLEYYGSKDAKTVLVAMGSMVGTIKEVIDQTPDTAILKIKVLRPFPGQEILKFIKSAEHLAVLDKAISLGYLGPLAVDIKAVAQGQIKANIQSFIVGLGGRDVTKEMIKKILREVKSGSNQVKFIEK
jgi:pyruvate ferredoxin oxidoreductase alpha subunit